MYVANQTGYPRRVRDYDRGVRPERIELDDLPPWPGADTGAGTAPGGTSPGGADGPATEAPGVDTGGPAEDDEDGPPPPPTV